MEPAMQRIDFTTACLAVSALGIAHVTSGCSTAEAATKPRADDPIVSVATTTVNARSVPREMLLTGTIAANRESDVAAATGGKVTKTFAERGDHLTKGQPIARLDASAAALSRAEAVAQVGNARAQQEHARIECQRGDRLWENRVISRSEYDRIRTSCTTAQWSTAAASARVAMAGKTIGDATIRAPFSGVVAERFVTVGEYVQAGTRVATLVELDPLRLEIAIPESAFGQVKEGSAVRFEVSAFPSQTFSATVRYVGPALRRAGRDLLVEAVVPNGDKRLRPGMFAAARVQIGTETRPVVPSSALSGSGRSRRAFVVKDKRLEERVVLVGEPVTGGGIAVLSGLTAGERIAAKIAPDVRDGTRVE
jgi:membrane fusion protein (multidrug efflux system)